MHVASTCNLFGRDREISQLLDALNRISRGGGELILLPGLSGSGKTSLANALREPAESRNGFFLEGKFNQFDQNVAFVAWRHALAEFCNNTCMEPAERQQRWAAAIQEAVGDNGQLLVDLVPEFACLLGRQQPLATISLQESRHRFAAVIRETLKVICQPEHPLVLFIDDWQWADPASLHLLTQLQVGSALRYVLIVASYRSDEVNAQHGFTKTLDELRALQVNIRTTKVSNLSRKDVRKLVAREFSSQELADDVIEGIQSTSRGNPFFARALIELVRSRVNDSETEHTNSEFELPSNVVDVLRRRMSQFSEQHRRLLSLAACLGHRFNVSSLAAISGLSKEECEEFLMSFGGMIAPLETFEAGDASSLEQSGWYRFTHDRVQQAAYSSIPADEMPRIQMDIARKKIADMSATELTQQIYEVVDHFNAGADLVTEPADIVKGVKLNILAARKARSATAFHSALRFHRSAQQIICSEGRAEFLWRDHPELAMALHLEQAETEFLEGDNQHAEKLVRTAVAKSTTPAQQADALTLLVVQQTLQARYDAAITTGREALVALEVALPQNQFSSALEAEVARIRSNIQGRSLESIVELPFATDEKMMAVAKVLVAMGPPCYRAHQQLWSVIVLRLVNLTLCYGHIPQTGYSYPAIVGLLGWLANDYTTGSKFYRIVEKLMMGELASKSDQTVFRLMIGSSSRHWFEHMRNCSTDYEEAIQRGKQSGNLQYAAYAFGHNMYCQFFQGRRLDILARETESSLVFSRSRQNQWAIDLLEGGLQVFSDLASAKDQAESNKRWEECYLSKVQANHNQQVACIFEVMKAEQHLLLGQIEQALERSNSANRLIHTVGTQGLLPWAEHVFARTMILSRLSSQSAEHQAQHCGELERLIGQLRLWAEHCPENFEHKCLLAEAEFAHQIGRFDKAAELFDFAIDAARTHGFVQWEALANELASGFWKQRSNGRLEQVYWQRAYDCYENWGAKGKLELMISSYREQLCKGTQSQKLDGAAKSPNSATQRLLDRQVDLLRERTEEIASARHQARAAIAAEELASAADSLRADLAAGRRSAFELREQRDAEHALNIELERRVKRRTAALEESAKSLRKANTDLEQMEQRFRATVESAPTAMIMFDKDGRILLVNSEMEKLFGYHRQELLGKDLVKIVPMRFKENHLNRRAKFFSELEPQRLGAEKEIFCVHRDGTEFPVEIGLNPVNTDEGVFALGAIIDVTERIQAEKKIMQANETLAKSNTELEQFAYVASHDLQEPLRKIASFCQLLQEEQSHALDEDGKEYLQIAINGAKRLQTMVRDLLAFSRISTHNKPLVTTDANLSLHDAMADLAMAIEEKNASIDYELLPKVLGDPGQLTQVFQNLIGNAIKYCSEEIPRVVIGFKDLGSIYEFFVKDNGIGIDPEFHARIFEVFQRLHNRRSYSGTGIGLALSKRVIERFGGEIRVESSLGNGSTFFFTLEKPGLRGMDDDCDDIAELQASY